MPVPKSTVKSLSASHSNSSSILNNHPHPHIHHHIHSKYHYPSKVLKTEEQAVDSKPEREVEVNETKNPTSWDLQDDLLLRHLKEIRKFGWKEISKYFINRTPNAGQFRWRRLKSGNLKTNHTVTMDIYSIDTATILKNMGVDKKLPDLIDPQKNNDADILLPQVEIKTQIDATTTPKNGKSGKKTKKQHHHHHHHDVTSPLSRPHIEEAANIKLSASTTLLSHSMNTVNNGGNVNGELQPHGMRKSLSSVSIPTFAKPRSFSLNVARPNLNMSNLVKHSDVFQPEEENIGFIPKIIVRSRRSSFTNNPNTNIIIPANVTGLDVSRRNSIVTSRRASFNLTFNSAATSRRSSFIIPNEFIDTQLTSPKSNHLHPATTATITTAAATVVSNGNSNNIQHGFSKWEQDEDKLLLDLINIKNLNLKEVSILLPNRSEEEIKWRFQYLSKDKSLPTIQLNDTDTQLK